MKSVYFHAALLAGSLFFAWSIWTREDSGATQAKDEDETEVVFDIPLESVQELNFESERRKVKIAISGSAENRSYDVSTYRRDERRRPPPRPAKNADGGVQDGGAAPEADGGAPAVEVTETRKRFSGNKALVDWLKTVAPFRAKRSFGTLPRATLGEFELVEPRGTFTLRARGKTYTLKVGGTPFGSSDAYVQDARSGRVYLVAASVVRDLEFAESRFMQRELVRAETKEIAKVKIEAAGRSKTLVQQNRAASGTRAGEGGPSWTAEATPRTRNELYDNWMRRLLGLRAIEYLAPGEEPHAEGVSTPAVPVVEVECFGDRESLGTIRIVKLEGDPDAYYARSDATRGWVKLSGTLAEQVERDIEAVLR
ncbi:MAG: DUF4340 domain-containing protein [Deltaproteobacteria bacterium]|nr:DUF4340 domain-containing protein [Deltaproteobacteria bacterium]